MHFTSNLSDVASIVSLLAALQGLDTHAENIDALKDFIDMMSVSGLLEWTVLKYSEAFHEIPELAALTTTPL